MEEFELKLVEILKKEIAALTKDDIAFLQARRSYLTSEQLEKFADVLKSKLPKAKPEGPTAEDIIAGRDLDELSYKDLQKVNKVLGLPYVGVGKDELKVAISTNLGPEAAPKPD